MSNSSSSRAGNKTGGITGSVPARLAQCDEERRENFDVCVLPRIGACWKSAAVALVIPSRSLFKGGRGSEINDSNSLLNRFVALKRADFAQNVSTLSLPLFPPTRRA